MRVVKVGHEVSPVRRLRGKAKARGIVRGERSDGRVAETGEDERSEVEGDFAGSV